MRSTTNTPATPAWRKTPPVEATDAQPNEEKASVAVAEEKETIVFRGKYSGDWDWCVCARPWLDSPVPPPPPPQVFEVIEVIKGDLPAKVVKVSLWGDFAKPKELKAGTVYTLRFTPSERARQSLRERQEKDGEYRLGTSDRLEVIENDLQ